ncbi:MAG: hypothetical protein K0V04_15360 [Deltaproteobacteria bacterium]|nr:hypothetical protein [Deltaproteobacteria bacterium]
MSALGLLLSACVLDSQPAGELPSDGGGGGTANGTDGSASTGPDATGPGASGPGATGPSPTGSGTDAVDDSSSSTDDPTVGNDFDCPQPVVGVACEPPGTAVSSFSVLINGEESQSEDITEVCIVSDVFDDGQLTRIVMDCGVAVGSVEVRLTTTDPHIGFEFSGPSVALRYAVGQVDEVNLARHLVLREPGFDRLLVAAIDATEYGFPNNFDLAPLQMDLVPSDCEPTNTEFDILTQNAAIEASYAGETVHVFDNGMQFAGGFDTYAIFTEDVERIHCWGEDSGYNYAVWFVHAIAIYVPEG